MTTISYELAKRMKEAGFLQIYKCGCDIENCIHLNYPTLEEVIEALGDDLLGLNKSFTNDKDYTWIADTRTHECNCGKCNGYNWENGEGSTPLEAVCNLWLAINEKK